MKRLRYVTPTFGSMPVGDIGFVDTHGRIAEPLDGDDPEKRMEFELARGCYAHVGDRAKRFDPFVIKRHAETYLVIFKEANTATFATLKEAVRHGLSHNGPWRLLRDTQ